MLDGALGFSSCGSSQGRMPEMHLSVRMLRVPGSVHARRFRSLRSHGDSDRGSELVSVVQGAVYVTKNAAYSWQAAVQESVDATLNRTVSSGRA